MRCLDWRPMNGIAGPTEQELKTRIAALERKVSRLYAHLQIEEPGPAEPGEVPEAVAEALAEGDKLRAVKAYREAMNVGIAEAQQAIERINETGSAQA